MFAETDPVTPMPPPLVHEFDALGTCVICRRHWADTGELCPGPPA